MRILAIDPGERRIGLAISDPTGTIASPLTVLKHVSRSMDAAIIADLAHEHQAQLIVVGTSADEEGAPTSQSRRADRLANSIQQQCELPIIFWDESFSTREARQAQVAMGTKQSKRRGHLDALAATVILQSYLDAKAK
jgi:putative Holliday junction resolvase